MKCQTCGYRYILYSIQAGCHRAAGLFAGSDEGSNSPRAPFTRNSTPSGEPSKPQTAAVGGPKRTPQQGMFSLGSGIDHARMAAATSQLQHQQPSTLTHPLAQQPHAQVGPSPWPVYHLETWGCQAAASSSSSGNSPCAPETGFPSEIAATVTRESYDLSTGVAAAFEPLLVSGYTRNLLSFNIPDPILVCAGRGSGCAAGNAFAAGAGSVPAAGLVRLGRRRTAAARDELSAHPEPAQQPPEPQQRQDACGRFCGSACRYTVLLCLSHPHCCSVHAWLGSWGPQVNCDRFQHAVGAGEGSLMDRKSSGVASMDTFRANSSRSYSVPPGIATGTGESKYTLEGDPHQSPR